MYGVRRSRESVTAVESSGDTQDSSEFGWYMTSSKDVTLSWLFSGDETKRTAGTCVGAGVGVGAVRWGDVGRDGDASEGVIRCAGVERTTAAAEDTNCSILLLGCTQVLV